MLKNRIAQLVYYSIYAALGIVAIVSSFGIFNINEGFEWNFYVYFTNLSNYYCIIIVLLQLIFTYKKVVNKETEGYCESTPVLKYLGLSHITVTFIIFNFVLAGTRESYLNFRVGSLLMHLVLPILYILDWVLFYEHKKINWKQPFLSLLFPFIYIFFVLIRVGIIKWFGLGTEDTLVYPYFFLNVENLNSFMMWMGIFLVSFTGLGYAFFGIDKLIKERK